MKPVSAPARIAAFATAVGVAGLLGAGVGTVVGPLDVGGDHDGPPPATAPDPSAPPHDQHGGG